MARKRQLALVWLLLSLSAAAAWPSLSKNKKEETKEDKLIAWALAQGAQLKGFAVGQACPTCVRGVIASTDLSPGDVIVKLPFTAVVRLKDLDHAGFPAEYARDLLDWLHNKPDFNETWSLFWSVMDGGPDSTFTPEVYRDEHLELLQSSELADLARGQREVTEQVYDGSYPHAQYEPFAKTVPADRVSLDTFKVVSSLIGSRYFGFYRDGNSESSSHLVPLVDLINHADNPNAERSDDGDNVLVKAVTNIKKGEEIFNNYQPNVIHRPDMSLYIYGFVVPQDQPFLSSVDLPTFDPVDPFSQTKPDDSDHYPGGEYATRDEYDRLSQRLAALPTTEAEDQALLDGDTITDWRVRSILQYRVMRKRALRQTLERLASILSINDDDSGSSGSDATVAAAAAEEGEEQEVEVEQVDAEVDEKEEL